MGCTRKAAPLLATMGACARKYITPDQAAIEPHWHIGRDNPFQWPKVEIVPGRPGLFLRGER